ncbi:TPA: site-specific integrase [Vibrio parahaemolyticus]|uniref:site-specific integrase n=1 Tax=Vibrio parahaemolyticus TaxID=670 RepID=UPI001122245C|nr:site-specific integrase [Vibrio parahaemolyticus]MBM5068162.1 site-specific integrase [Vibrio parahaemolyticus]MBO0235438.1 site-specific integrase [Vibrio parahaemolyticus]MDG2623749.1 site-specific integrase [Vibrio parahaemolyticus]TOE32106.1 hypothetical protein CGJ46_16675 [Vibrio parahaemolyticus]HCG6868926.1 site-specific integrase [Vibrio parahaemolyticus]
MRYLHISKSGTWQFRYQVPPHHRHLFGDRREIKRSLKTSDKAEATIKALELEIQVRKIILTPASSVSIERQPISPITPAKSASIKTISPHKALERFCKYKTDHISPKAVKMLEAKCKIVLDLVGKPHLKAIRRSDAEGVASLLRKYPANLKKHRQFNGLSGHQAIELNKNLGLPTLSEESVRDYCQKLSGFFEWCQLNELTDVNPFKALRFKKTRKDSEAKCAYTDTDLEKIFSAIISTKHKHPYYFWLPLLAYFTGARLNELCQLYKADIYKVEGIWVIQIDDRFEGQKLKNLTSRRIVPIHDQLLNLGFIEYVRAVHHERIFPELKESRDGFGTAASKWFGRFKSTLGFGRGHDFHSFRHTVATQFKRQSISHIVAGELLGHAQNSITYDRYGKGLDVNQLKEVINMIDATPVSKPLKNQHQ